MIDRLAAMLRSAVTRAKITTSSLGLRTIAQVTGLANETKQSVEVLHPFGWFANPAAGADVVLLQVMGSRDHLVALGGDALNQSEACAQGEFGAKHSSGAFVRFTNDGRITLQDPSGSQVILQNNGTVAITGNLLVTGDIFDQNAAHGSLATLRTAYNAHGHGNVTNGGGTTDPTNDPVA